VIALIDYGAGNLTSVRKALAFLGADVESPTAPEDLTRAAAIIVPGVGHFEATRALDADWRGAIRATLDRGAPLLGICLGMQWLFEGSDEAPGLPGLGLLPGVCTRLPEGNPLETSDSPGRLKVPHVGWNDLSLACESPLTASIAPGAQVYFTHSYRAPVTTATVAITTYGVPFAAALQSGQVAGVQFHPEKSGDVGLRILQNWLDAIP
jgi:glutamine amidotransferase